MKEVVSHKKILPYQESWPQKFATEKEKLQHIFDSEKFVIEHIGSTSISGLSSKDIIDIAILIDNVSTADAFIDNLKQIGYIHDVQGSSTERHFFRKYGEDNFHLSLGYKNQGSFWQRQILFRNFLRKNNEYRDEYQKLKEDLIEEYPDGSDEYMRGKTAFVERVLKLADCKE